MDFHPSCLESMLVEDKWSYPTADLSGQSHFSEVIGAEKKIMYLY